MATELITCADCSNDFERRQMRGRRPTYCPGCRQIRDRASNTRKAAQWRASHPEKARAAYERWNARHRDNPERLARKRRNEMRRLHGIEPEEYDRMLAACGGRCEICNQPPRGRANGRARPETVPSLHVDHDHDTGRVRGMLCSNCNTMLGLAGDDPEVLQAAVKYLRR